MTTPTGRMGRPEPNIQNIPVRTPEGAAIRQAFTRRIDEGYFEQLRRAGATMARHHDKMMAAGFKWDGMDGYEAPAGFTKEQCDRLWQETLAEEGLTDGP